jgi:hypothetical protein
VSVRKPRAARTPITADQLDGLRRAWEPSWQRIEARERDLWILKRGLTDRSARRLSRVESVVSDLWRQLASGQNVDARIDVLYRAATGRHDESDARLELMFGIAGVAHSMSWNERMLADTDPDPVYRAIAESHANPTDGRISWLVLVRFKHAFPDETERLHGRPNHEAMIADAVRAWRRGRGRQRRGEVRKWSAVGAVIEAAGLGTLDERALQKLWDQRERK